MNRRLIAIPGASGVIVAVLVWALGASLCSACDTPSKAEADLGPIEAVIDEVATTVWPGNVKADGTRHIRRLNGFFNGEATSYWFIGFASRVTADVFFVCREGESGCPFDDQGAIAWDKLVGDPIFARIPGEAGYSPFWLSWVVTVGSDYTADDLKSVFGIEAATERGDVSVAQVVFDHGGTVGPAEALLHCLLVLEGTELQDNGADLVGQPGIPTMEVPIASGWHKQYRVTFFDFTPSEGVFSPDPATESRALQPSSDIFVMFRNCAAGSDAPACQLVNADLAAVSERGVETDINADGDKADTNNVVVAVPGESPVTSGDKEYSPLWRVNVVKILPEHDAAVSLIDMTGGQNDTGVKSVETIRTLVDAGMVEEPEFMSEAMAGNSISGNDGKVFFNCPSQVPVYE